MICMGGNDFFRQKISRTDRINRPFSSTFGWIMATPRQPQRPHALRTRWVSRQGTKWATRRASVLVLVAVRDFFSMKKMSKNLVSTSRLNYNYIKLDAIDEN
jgi:hypothetical protein